MTAAAGWMASDTRTDRLVALLFVLALCGYSLVAPVAAVSGIDSRVISVPYRALVVALSLAALAGVYGSRSERYIGIHWLPFIAFWLLYSLRILADTLGPAPLRLKPWEYVLYAYGFCFLPAMACLSSASERARAKIPRYLLIISFAACAGAIAANIQAIRNGTFAASILSGRFALETLNPITFGELGAITGTVACWSWLTTRGRARWLYLLPLLVGLTCTAISGSRGPVVALGLALIIIFGAASRDSARGRAAILLTAIAVIVAFVLGSMWIEHNIGFRTLSRFATGEIDESGDLRRHFIAGAWKAYTNHPLLGAGIDEPTSGEYPHNLIIESFMSIGTLGGLVFLALFLGALARAARLLRRRDPVIHLIVALFAQQCISAMLSGALYLTGAFWCTMGIVLASAVTEPERLSMENNA